MIDPALEKSLAQLAGVLKRLNEESDTLNTTISDFEQMLVGLNPGIAAWAPNPIRLQPETDSRGEGSLLVFAKHGDEWRLWARRSTMVKSGEGWRSLPGGQSKVVPLVEATREERVAALDQFPVIVELLTQEAKARLALVERANKAAR